MDRGRTPHRRLRPRGLTSLNLLHPDEKFTLTELARRLGVSLPTLHAEVQRLVAAGILESRPVGRSRVVRSYSRTWKGADLEGVALRIAIDPAHPRVARVDENVQRAPGRVAAAWGLAGLGAVNAGVSGAAVGLVGCAGRREDDAA